MKRALFFMLLIGCGSTPTTTKPVLVEVAPTEVIASLPDVAPEEPEPPTIEAPALVSMVGRVDDIPGDEEVVLRAGGRLQIGEVEIRIERQINEDRYAKEAELTLVGLDKVQGVRAVLLTTPGEGEEDPPNRYRLYLYDGSQITKVLDEVIGSYGVTPIVFVGDGTAHYVEDGRSACNRTGAQQAAREEVIFRLDAARRAMPEVSRQASGIIQDCTQLAACPFVYMGDATERAGEILRNMHGTGAYGQQSLSLPASDDPAAPLALRIAEEKVEVTFIDALWLEIGDLRVAPESCASASPPSYCEADGEMLVLRQGESLALEFEPIASGPLSLQAVGYYIPTPTAATRGR